MESYWDLYVAYVHKCVADNWANDIDPAHYEMEWNHFLPQCIFGNQPIGHWLSKRQHAIASALQTLAFNRNCMIGRHKRHIPGSLLNLVWPIFCRSAKRASEKGQSKLKQLGLGAAYDPVQRKAVTEKALSPRSKTKRKETYLRIKHQQGSNNSQYGTMWITDGSVNKKIKKEDNIPEGYWRGRTL